MDTHGIFSFFLFVIHWLFIIKSFIFYKSFEILNKVKYFTIF